MRNVPVPETTPARVVSRRVARNLLLSVTGGVALSLAGQAVAHAQDATSDSSGAGAVGSGNADATGNVANNDTHQGLDGTSSGTGVASQNGAINNSGVAIADTGRNVATGNNSNNGATANQTASGATGPGINSGTASNGSDGSARITTGDRDRGGVQLDQLADPVGHAVPRWDHRPVAGRVDHELRSRGRDQRREHGDRQHVDEQRGSPAERSVAGRAGQQLRGRVERLERQPR